MQNIETDYAGTLVINVGCADYDILEQTVSISFSFMLDVTEDGEPDWGATSPLYAGLDRYYERVCTTLFPGSRRWQGAWPHMFADFDGAFPRFVAGTQETIIILTKWIVPPEVMDRFFDVIENIDLLEECGLTIFHIEGVSDGGASGASDVASTLRTVLHPLELEDMKMYPFNFTRHGVESSSSARSLSDLGLQLREAA